MLHYQELPLGYHSDRLLQIISPFLNSSLTNASFLLLSLSFVGNVSPSRKWTRSVLRRPSVPALVSPFSLASITGSSHIPRGS